MEMQQVRYFLAVAQTLNFTRAAEQCNVSQPALTRAIKLLEDELGGDLIRREGRLSHLTDLGQRMLPLLRQCHESAITAKALATSLKKGEIATLNVAVASAVDIALLMPALSEMYGAFPELLLRLKRGGAIAIRQMLEKGEVDLTIGSGFGEGSDRLDSWRMFEDYFDIIVSDKHDLARGNGAALEAAQLCDHRLLLHKGVDATEAEVERLTTAGLSLINVHEVDSLADLEALVRAQFGVGLTLASALRTDGIRHLRIESVDVERPVSVCMMSGRPRSREATTLLNLLRGADWSVALG
jgi:DNA-binding transcriptional LysR family regulator